MDKLGSALAEQGAGIHSREGVGGNRFEAAGFEAELLVVGHGDLKLWQGGMGLPDFDQAGGIAEGERLEEDGVDHPEHSGVDADPEGDRQNSRGRKQWTAPEGTEGEAHSEQCTSGTQLRFQRASPPACGVV